MKTRGYTSEIEKTKKGDRIYKKYKFIFIIEFEYQNATEWIEKTRLYLKQYNNIHFIECDHDNNFCIYLRHKKYILGKGVNSI